MKFDCFWSFECISEIFTAIFCQFIDIVQPWSFPSHSAVSHKSLAFNIHYQPLMYIPPRMLSCLKNLSNIRCRKNLSTKVHRGVKNFNFSPRRHKKSENEKFSQLKHFSKWDKKNHNSKEKFFLSEKNAKFHLLLHPSKLGSDLQLLCSTYSILQLNIFYDMKKNRNIKVATHFLCFICHQLFLIYWYMDFLWFLKCTGSELSGSVIYV